MVPTLLVTVRAHSVCVAFDSVPVFVESGWSPARSVAAFVHSSFAEVSVLSYEANLVRSMNGLVYII